VQDCPAAANPPSTGVVIYIVAHQDTISGPDKPSPDGSQDPDGPDAPERPHDPVGPDAPEDSPVPDGANVSDDHDDASVPDDTGPADDGESADGIDHSGDPDPAATDSAADESAGLDGHPPPMFAKPWREGNPQPTATSMPSHGRTGQRVRPTSNAHGENTIGSRRSGP
ncbi:MAG: hypothetical protein ACRDUX_29040, partial [Mycobacterium sp.]